MKNSIYVSLTRIVLCLALLVALLGSLAFIFLADVTQYMPFSNF